MANCKDCCREISEEDIYNYKGYCKSCYEEAKRKEAEIKSNNSNTESNYTNYVARIIKVISVIGVLCGIVFGIRLFDYYEEIALTMIMSIALVAIFFYGIGEIIQLLEDIKNK